MRLLILYIVFFFSQTLLAKDKSSLQVRFVEGNVFILVNKKTQKIKKGLQLNSSDTLKLDSDTRLHLLHSSGRELIVSSVGYVRVSNILSNLNGYTDPSWHQKYFEFVVQSLQKKQDALQNKEVVGGVERSIIKNEEINFTHIDSNVILLKWSSNTNTKQYHNITIKDFFGEIKTQFKVLGNTAIIDIGEWEKETRLFCEITKDNN
jgi:hypothetical protein